MPTAGVGCGRRSQPRCTTIALVQRPAPSTDRTLLTDRALLTDRTLLANATDALLTDRSVYRSLRPPNTTAAVAAPNSRGGELIPRRIALASLCDRTNAARRSVCRARPDTSERSLLPGTLLVNVQHRPIATPRIAFAVRHVRATTQSRLRHRRPACCPNTERSARVGSRNRRSAGQLPTDAGDQPTTRRPATSPHRAPPSASIAKHQILATQRHDQNAVLRLQLPHALGGCRGGLLDAPMFYVKPKSARSSPTGDREAQRHGVGATTPMRQVGRTRTTNWRSSIYRRAMMAAGDGTTMAWVSL